MKIFQLLLFLSSFFLFSTKATAQCCAAGSPNSDNSFNPNGSKNIFGISLNYTHSLSDKYYKADTYLSDYHYLSSFYDFSSLQLSYGISSKLNVIADIGYFYSKAQEFPASQSFPEGYKRKAYGLADATLSFSYKLFDFKKSKLAIFPLTKITFPVGKFDQMYGPVVLPVDLQPSSGNFKLLLGYMLNKRMLSSPVSIGSIGSAEFSKWINTDRTVYKYGNLYNVSFFGLYTFKKNLSLKGIIRYQYRERATNEDKELVNASGGSVFFASVNLGYNFMKTWKVDALIELPFYKYVNGTQLTQNYLFTFTVSKNIDLSKRPDVVAESEKSAIASAKIKVFGACEMCKERIEKVALNFPDVVYCNYDLKSHKLTIGHNGNLNVGELEKALAAVGHDTENVKADDAVYEALPPCCHYRK